MYPSKTVCYNHHKIHPFMKCNHHFLLEKLFSLFFRSALNGLFMGAKMFRFSNLIISRPYPSQSSGLTPQSSASSWESKGIVPLPATNTRKHTLFRAGVANTVPADT